MNYNNYNIWATEARRLGYAIENNGGNKAIAHLDGFEKGWWDPCYGGAGMGWGFTI